LKFVFEKAGIIFEPRKFEGQVGIVFSNKDLVETASLVYQFAKTRELLKILGGFAIKDKRFVEAAEIKRLGQLPSREILLGQLIGVLSAPLRRFLFVLNEKTKQ